MLYSNNGLFSIAHCKVISRFIFGIISLLPSFVSLSIVIALQTSSIGIVVALFVTQKRSYESMYKTIKKMKQRG